jgi:hypothetical protein
MKTSDNAFLRIPEGHYLRDTLAGFLPRLPKQKNSERKQLEEELSELRKIDRRAVLPEVVDLLKGHIADLEQKLKAIQRK